MKNALLLILFASVLGACSTSALPQKTDLSASQILSEATQKDWRTPKPQDLVYFYLPTGLVIFELNNEFAPRHGKNIRKLIQSRYWDGLNIIRAQDNYVVQWGAPNEKRKDWHRTKKPFFKKTLAAEIEKPWNPNLSWVASPYPDSYAEQGGFSGGFPAGRSFKEKKIWLTHCYGAVGAGRDQDIHSGSIESLYVIIGQAPRHLDRNISLVGRVLYGMEQLSTQKRGKGELGFYKDKTQGMKILKVRLESELPLKKRKKVQVFRTESPLFRKLIEARANRSEDWFYRPIGSTSLCNIPIPVKVE